MTVRNNNAQFVSHKKSRLKVDGKPKLPSSNDLHEGEIAINFAKDVETLSIKNESGDVVTFSSDNYYSEQKLGSAFTGANSAVTVTDYINGLDMGNEVEVNSGDTPTGETIELWVDESVDPAVADVYTKTEVDTLLEGKLDEDVFESYSGTVIEQIGERALQGDLEALSSVTTGHTANTDIHVTTSDKTAWDAKLDDSDVDQVIDSTTSASTMPVATKAVYDVVEQIKQDFDGDLDDLSDKLDEHSGNTVMHITSAERTAWNAKVDASDLAIYADAVKYNSTTHYVEFYNGTTAGTKVFEYDASPFLIDGMVDNVEITDISGTTYLVVSFNTDAGKQDIEIPVSEIFDADEYYTKDEIDEADEIVAAALNDLEERKMDASGMTNYYTKSETSGANEISDAVLGLSHDISDVDAKLNTHSADTTLHFTTEQKRIFIDLTKYAEYYSGITSADTTNWDNKQDQLVSGTNIKTINSESLLGSGDILIDVPDELWVSGTGLNSVVLKGSSGTAIGDYSVAEGSETIASGNSSHAEGKDTVASGNYSHAEGDGTTASGLRSHTEGMNTLATANAAHAEGLSTSATSYQAHAEGASTLAGAQYSHAEGQGTVASGNSSHAEGDSTKAIGAESHAEGHGSVANGINSHAEGYDTRANGDYSHAEGDSTKAIGAESHAEGHGSVANGINSHAEGYDTRANGDYSHAEGDSTSATSDSSHSEGYKTKASGYYAHAEGHYTLASADQSHAEGQQTSATTHSAHAEGVSTLASGTYGAHAEGNNTTASGAASHAEGTMTKANGDYSHAEGNGTTAVGSFSHAEGNGTTANSVFSHVEGWATVANNPGEHASGKYNVSNTAATDSGQTLFSVGNGTYDSRHNAFEIRQNGDIYIVDKNGQDVRLQDELGGGDSLWEAGTGLNSVVLKGSSGTASGDFAVAEGLGTSATSDASHAEGVSTLASGPSSHAEGYQTLASGVFSHTEGTTTTASGRSSHAEGENTRAIGNYSHAEGTGTTASGGYGAHAEGEDTSATSNSSHAEGYQTLASGGDSHAEGDSTSATSYVAHAEGNHSLASGDESHAEGRATKAAGEGSHAEGDNTEANGDASHAEGYNTIANGDDSHAEGYNTIANGDESHTEGVETIANNDSEHASGQYNISHSATTEFGDSGNTLFSVGNGYYDGDAHTVVRHNAFEIRQNGDIYIVSGNSDIKLQDYIGGGGGSITVDQVLDNTTSASTNPVSSKAVYDAVTDNELVWTNVYVTLSGTVSAHTADTSVHVTAADKEKLHTHSNKSALDTITGNVGTMAYENTSSYSSATQVSSALQGKSNSNHNQAANTITAMTGYVTSSTVSDISTSDTLNQAMAKLEARFGGVRIVKITQTDYDNLPTPRDSNILYVITD